MPTLKKLSVSGQSIPENDSGYQDLHIYYIHKIKHDFSPLDIGIPQKGSIRNANKQEVNLPEIQTLQVFFINTNYSTSRRKVTFVRHQTSCG